MSIFAEFFGRKKKKKLADNISAKSSRGFSSPTFSLRKPPDALKKKKSIEFENIFNFVNKDFEVLCKQVQEDDKMKTGESKMRELRSDVTSHYSNFKSDRSIPNFDKFEKSPKKRMFTPKNGLIITQINGLGLNLNKESTRESTRRRKNPIRKFNSKPPKTPPKVITSLKSFDEIPDKPNQGSIDILSPRNESVANSPKVPRFMTVVQSAMRAHKKGALGPSRASKTQKEFKKGSTSYKMLSYQLDIMKEEKKLRTLLIVAQKLKRKRELRKQRKKEKLRLQFHKNFNRELARKVKNQVDSSAQYNKTILRITSPLMNATGKSDRNAKVLELKKKIFGAEKEATEGKGKAKTSRRRKRKAVDLALRVCDMPGDDLDFPRVYSAVNKRERLSLERSAPAGLVYSSAASLLHLRKQGYKKMMASIE